MKKSARIVLPLMFLTIGLGACRSNNSSEQNNKTITFYLSGDKSEGHAYSKMAKEYEKETGVKVRITDVPYDDLTTKIDKAVQAIDEPDIARVSGVGTTWTSSLQDLSDIATSAKTNKRVTITDKESGEVKAIPSDLTSNGLFINRSLFDQVGVDYPKSDQEIWTWDNFIKALKQVQAKTDAKYGLVVDPSDHRLRTITYQFGGEDFQLNEKATAYHTDKNTIKALEEFISWNDNKLMPKTVWTSGEDPSAMFKSGQVAAYLSGSWQIKDFTENIKDFNWATTYMPYEKTRGNNLGGNFLVAFKNGKNTKGCKAFLKWLYKPANYKQLCEYAGYLPAVENMKIDYGKSQKDYDIIQNETDHASDMIGYQTTQGVQATINGKKGLSGTYKDAIANVINGQESLKTAIKQIEKDYNDGFLADR